MPTDSEVSAQRRSDMRHKMLTQHTFFAITPRTIQKGYDESAFCDHVGPPPVSA